MHRKTIAVTLIVLVAPLLCAVLFTGLHLVYLHAFPSGSSAS